MPFDRWVRSTVGKDSASTLPTSSLTRGASGAAAARGLCRLAAKPADPFEARDTPYRCAGGDALHLVGSGAFLQEIGEDLVDPPVDQRRIDTRFQVDGDLEDAELGEALVAGARRDGELLLL